MSISSRHYQRLAMVAVAGLIPAALAVQTTAQGAAPSAATASGSTTRTVSYDSFSKSGGYTMADYQQKWANGFGLGEMALNDTRSFKGSRFNISAAPFQTSADFSVFDHLKYIATSTQSFAVPATGSVEISSTIKAATPGTQPGRVIDGTYSLSGDPYAEPTLEGQQAGAVMNVIDFSTGQLFDWFISGNTAFALIERLPSNVTGNTTDPTSPAYVGRDQMYTQIVREVPAAPGVAHRVSIRFSRTATTSAVDYFLDGKLVAHVDHVGIPLDVQGQDYTGIYPSLGPGEELGPQINSLTIGHGLFSLLDAFPFQHPEAPELSVSIPVANRIFGQGAIASFDDFKVKTVTNK
jgi:Family of unknown function (DUF6081)